MKILIVLIFAVWNSRLLRKTCWTKHRIVIKQVKLWWVLAFWEFN